MTRTSSGSIYSLFLAFLNMVRLTILPQTQRPYPVYPG
jgi:hypothetical protein